MLTSPIREHLTGRQGLELDLFRNILVMQECLGDLMVMGSSMVLTKDNGRMERIEHKDFYNYMEKK